MPDDNEYQPTSETAPDPPTPGKVFPEKDPPKTDTSNEGKVVFAQHKSAAIAGDSAGRNELSFSEDFAAGAPLPEGWPDPRGFTPPGPSPTRPNSLPSREPIITHTKLYDATNSDVTQAAQ